MEEHNCIECNCPVSMITQRILTPDGQPIDNLEFCSDNCYRCLSCKEDGKKCVDCNLSEKIAIQNGHERFQTNGDWPTVWRCGGCRSNQPNLYTCEQCGREWDGFAQCPCELYGSYSSDEEDEDEKDKEDSMKESKRILAEMMELMYDMKDTVCEGKYLRMMNLIKQMNDNYSK